MHSLSPSGSDPEVAKRTKELFPKNFRDYPGGVEYFDVYSPTISSLYSQVFWKALDPSPLPEDVVKEYDGKAMAIVGFEVDQVFLTPDGEISVPINVAYNHHFESHMVGKGANFKKVKLSGPDDPIVMEHKKVMGHGMPSEEEAWVVEEVAQSSTPGVPTSQAESYRIFCPFGVISTFTCLLSCHYHLRYYVSNAFCFICYCDFKSNLRNLIEKWAQL